MSDNVERLSTIRRIVLMISAGSFLAWQVPMMDRTQEIAARPEGVSSLISLGGFVIWIMALLFLIGPWARLSRRRGEHEALNDELVQANRGRAWMVGYLAMMLASAGMFALSLFEPVMGVESAHLILVVGVVVPMFCFAFLERA